MIFILPSKSASSALRGAPWQECANAPLSAAKISGAPGGANYPVSRGRAASGYLVGLGAGSSQRGQPCRGSRGNQGFWRNKSASPAATRGTNSLRGERHHA